MSRVRVRQAELCLGAKRLFKVQISHREEVFSPELELDKQSYDLRAKRLYKVQIRHTEEVFSPEIELDKQSYV